MKHLLLSGLASAALLAACSPEDNQDTSNVRVSQTQAETALSEMGLFGDINPNITYATLDVSDNQAVFRDVVFQAEADDEGTLPTPVRVEEMIVTAPRLGANDMLELDGLTLNQISMQDEDTELSIRRIIVDQPNAMMANDIGFLFSGSSFEDESVDISAYTFRTFAIEDLELVANTPATKDAEASDVAIRFDRMGIDHDRETGLGELELSDFFLSATEDDTPVSFSVGSATLSGLATRSLIPLMQGTTAAALKGDDERVESAIENITAEFVGQFQSRPWEVYRSWQLNDFAMNASGIVIAMDAVHSGYEINGDIVTERMELGALTLGAEGSSTEATELAEALDGLGYDEMSLTASYEARIDTVNDRYYSVRPGIIELEDGLRITIDQDFSGYLAYQDANGATMAEYGLEQAEVPLEVTLSDLELLHLNRLNIQLEDNSLLERAFTLAGAEQGLTAEEMRAQMSALVMISMMGAGDAIPREVSSQLTPALMGFITNGGTLRIASEPDTPYSIGEVVQDGMSNTLDINALGLTITHEQ